MLCTDWLKFYYHYKGQCVGIRKLQLHKCSGGDVNRNPWLMLKSQFVYFLPLFPV
jgi:hypothetical protein